MVDIEKNGSAFVTFESVETVVNLLEKYERMEVVSFVSTTMASVMRSNALQFKGRYVC
jgi:hypothetical protein